MIINRKDFAVTITHELTGEKVCVDSTCVRSMAQAKQKAGELIRARVWAAQNGLKRHDAEIANYELPNNDQWPSDLSKYREDVFNIT